MLRILLIPVACLALLGCAQEDGPAISEVGQAAEHVSAAKDHQAAPSEGSSPQKIDAQHLPNPVQVHPKVISGGLPEGDAAFEELRSLGVKTVISVDGQKPDVDTAKKYGLRYVHLPHGYDGIPENRVQELAKAVRDLEGPIYIHCHHGKHRSPAAASVACVSAGLISTEKGLLVLDLAGTNPGYRGLFQSAQQARPLEDDLLDALKADFPEQAAIPPMAEAMVAIGHTHDHLKLIQEAGWQTPDHHPDLDPAHEALLLREHFTEMLRTEEVKQQPEAFQAMLRESETAAQKLEEQLNAWQAATRPARPPEELGNLANTINHNCKACHQQYRDIPLTEKTGK